MSFTATGLEIDTLDVTTITAWRSQAEPQWTNLELTRRAGTVASDERHLSVIFLFAFEVLAAVRGTITWTLPTGMCLT